MIHPDSRKIEWIEHVASLYPKVDKTLIEKTIRAFSLLESLVKSGCPFVFKGGTACMLHLNSSKRLSIDIDVICPPGTDISQYIEKFSGDYGFTEIELVNRLSAFNVPKTHAKYFYKVSYVTNKYTENILLDVLFEDIHYGQIVQLPIQSPFLKAEGNSSFVNVPSSADILGDKLTAFAPHTTGVPFYKEKRDCSLEIIKQMFDIASLFDIVNDFGQTISTFNKFAKVELGYRDMSNVNPNDILDDAIATAQCVSLRGIVNPGEFMLLQSGIKKIDNMILSSRYKIEEATTDAAKAAYIAAAVKYNITDIKRYADSSLDYMKTATMTCLNSKLNKLKRSNPEAFFYWKMADEIISQINKCNCYEYQI